MSRYVKLTRKLDEIFGNHVGVLDTKTNEVHEVCTPDGKKTVYRKVSLSEFKHGKDVKTVKTISPQSSDSEVEERLKQVRNWWNGWNRNNILYDAAGEKGVNCEHFAEVVLTGNVRSSQAEILHFLKIIGIVDKNYQLSSIKSV